MDVLVADIVVQIPGWADAKDLSIQPFGGFTNKNYLVTVDGEHFVLRISGKNSAHLGIRREDELEALTAAASAGIGADLVRFFPEGHLITRLIPGRHWTVDEYRAPQNLERIVQTVKRLHALPAVKGSFSSFLRVESLIRQAKTFRVPFPEDFDIFLERMQIIEAGQQRDTSSWLKFCHNDLFSVNFLDDGNIRIVDWEFAGMGDKYFDLATLVYAYDSDGPLSPELEAYLLEYYFGETGTVHQIRLQGMKFMLLFFTAMWGMLQHGMQKEGIVLPLGGFDCLDYARQTFALMRERLA